MKGWLGDTIAGWKRHPTPFIWGGKRQTRRDRVYAHRHRRAGSGVTTQYGVPPRIRAVCYDKWADNAITNGK